MLVGLNLGMEEPIGREVLEVARGLGVEVDRYTLPRDEESIAAWLGAWVGTGVRPQFLFSLGMAGVTATVVEHALEHYGPEGFDLEGPNEWRKVDGATLADAIADQIGRASGRDREE